MNPEINSYSIGKKLCVGAAALTFAGTCFGQTTAGDNRTAPLKKQANGACFAEIMDRATPAPSGIEISPLVTTTIQHYEVRGETYEDLRREFNAKGRHGYAGWTSAEVTYRFKSQKYEAGCRILEARASCDSQINLPNWLNLRKAPTRMQAWWKESQENLKKHEQGHVQICVEVAKEVERAIWATPSSSDCYLVDLNARNRATRAIAKMNYLQMRYDKCEYDLQPQ